MLQKLRKFSESKVSQLFLALILMSFVLWGMGDLYKSVTANYVAMVGKVKISEQQFDYMLKEEMSRVRAQVGAELANMMQESIKANLIETRLNRILLNRQVAESGIIISDKAVAEYIRSLPTFQDKDGKFSREKYDSFMRTSGRTESALVQELKADMALEQLTGVMFDAAKVAPSVLKANFLSQNETRRITLYTIGKSSAEDSTHPSEKEIQDYYEANKMRFMKPETRGGEYVLISAAAVKDEAVVKDEEVRQEYDNNIDLYGSPEKRSLGQILCDSKEEAEEVEKAIQGGMEFDEAQLKFCKKLKMNLPDVTAKDLPEGVSVKAFALKENQVSEVVESPLGFHIFKALKVIEAKQQSFDEVKEKIRTELAQRKNEDGLYQVLGKVEDMALAKTSLKEIAEKFGLEVKKFAPITASGKASDELMKLKDFVKVLFSTEANTVSQVRESTGGEYYLLSPTAVTTAAPKSMDEVKGEIVESIRKQKQAEILRAKAAEIAKSDNPVEKAGQLKAALSSRQVTINRAGKFGESSVPNGLASEVFKTAKGAITSAYQTHEGEFVFARVEEVIPATYDEKSEKTTQLKKQLEKQMQDDVFILFTEHLRKKYDARINYEVLDKIAVGGGK